MLRLMAVVAFNWVALFGFSSGTSLIGLVGERGLPLNLAIGVSNIIVATLSLPWNNVFGDENLPTFLVGVVAAAMSDSVAIFCCLLQHNLTQSEAAKKVVLPIGDYSDKTKLVMNNVFGGENLPAFLIVVAAVSRNMTIILLPSMTTIRNQKRLKTLFSPLVVFI
ncbi:hypothetical protein S245_014074, partial [Arachis hypogaea]